MADSVNTTPLPGAGRRKTSGAHQGAPLLTLAAELAANLADPEASDDRWDLADAMAATVPNTPAEAAELAALLTNPDIGLEAGFSGTHVTAARNLEAGLRAMAAPSDAGPGEPSPASAADAFGAAIAAFDQAAERALALPLEPTPGMVDAAVAATGCTAAKARAGFAAMVEAYRREAA